MKKIKITENQFNLIKLLKENIDFVERAKNKFTELKKDANILYNMITFSTVAEFIDGDTDLDVIERKIERLEDDLRTVDTNIMNYFNRFDENTYYQQKLDEVHADLESRSSTINSKIKALTKMTAQLKPFTKLADNNKIDVSTAFNDITTTEI